MAVIGDISFYDTDYNPFYYDKNGPRVGRVEVCADGVYGAVCNYQWDNREASVACGQLGFSTCGKATDITVLATYVRRCRTCIWHNNSSEASFSNGLYTICTSMLVENFITCYLMILGAIGVDADLFHGGETPQDFIAINCHGNETNLMECERSPSSAIYCPTAGVICQG